MKALAPTRAVGRAFGWYNAVPGWLALPAAILTGWLWEHSGALLALGTCAAMALVSAGLVLAFFAEDPAKSKA